MKSVYFALVLFFSINVAIGYQWPSQSGTASRDALPTRDPRRAKRASDDSKDNMYQIPPLSVLKAISKINNTLDFMDQFVIADLPTALGITSGGGRRPSDPKASLKERNIGYPNVPPATCSPQPTTVPLELKSSPYELYYPSCARLDRCAGCCSSDLLECTPVKTEKVVYQVYKSSYLGPPIKKFEIPQQVTVELERHLECECLCRTKSTDCKYYQKYLEGECRCACTNEGEMKNCGGDKIWDPSKCSCMCREVSECSTGYFFNMTTCKCEIRSAYRLRG